MDFEKKLARLEEIVQRMEKGDINLEDSLKMFEEGVRLSRECQTQLTGAEAQIKKLSGFDAAGNPVLVDFKNEEASKEADA